MEYSCVTFYWVRIKLLTFNSIFDSGKFGVAPIFYSFLSELTTLEQGENANVILEITGWVRKAPNSYQSKPA
jgi:hypothetical protein